MSLADLPSELLIEIVGYLRPDETSKPTTGVDAAWRRLVTPTRVADDEEVSQTEHNRPLSPYSSLYALSV